MKTLFLGEIVGKCGLSCIIKGLKSIDRDLTIANAEGLAGGYGLTEDGAKLLFRNKCDVLTGGEKIFYKKDMVNFITTTSRVLRPLNLGGKEVPGYGLRYMDFNGDKIAVMNLIGQIDMKMYGSSSPFGTCERTLKKIEEQGVKTIFVVFHAQATCEKQALFRYLDGKATAVIGTHTKVLTADACVSQKGTAYISDNGRCGSFMSVGGLYTEIEIKKEKTGQIIYSKDTFEEPEIQGVLVESENGKAISISIIKQKIELDLEAIQKRQKA